MASFWKHVKQVLSQSEIIIEVLDARFVKDSRNKELEDKVMNLGKKLLFVVNKSDLADKKTIETARKQLSPCVFISSTEKQGTTILKKKILEVSKSKKLREDLRKGARKLLKDCSWENAAKKHQKVYRSLDVVL